jgi:dTDP-glucose 4,6-dehydratase
MTKTYVVTGGCGFIGSHFIAMLLEAGHRVINLDKLTYAASPDSLKAYQQRSSYTFVEGDIADEECVRRILTTHQPDYVVNFAAESHVDNSIAAPKAFVMTNIVGTYTMLQESLLYWRNLSEEQQQAFRFLHVSTDEVYGSLPSEGFFTEDSKYLPNSPYSASKAASDHLVRAWHQTYGLPTVTTNCSNNFGPWQHDEKLIPTVIRNALAGNPIPIYGDGKNIRDWIYVKDHCAFIHDALLKGHVGEVFCLGTCNEQDNLSMVKNICHILDELCPLDAGQSYASQIAFVKDRLGHDRRYAIDNTKAVQELGLEIKDQFKEHLKTTVSWYIHKFSTPEDKTVSVTA